ncbi:hypothetical protein HDU93_003245 [Gonapodya sp. JEL0774]|nr:hypothetical protein HDU93_003245 [Gonapodya sp. JEL0774]
MGDFSAQNRGKQNSHSENARDPAYFGYYAQLTHQQNMLQDTVRTSTYHSAIVANSALFLNKTVLDVGAGSAGAAKVYAVEASNMALKMKKLLDQTTVKNTWMRGKVNVIQSKIEDADSVIPPVDIIVSEPIGVLLVHERMVESFLLARDRYLKPGGTLFPSSGTIFLAPFTDATLWTQTMAKVRFWETTNFYGVDLSPLVRDARNEVFGMPGIASWFDIHFAPGAGSVIPVTFTLSTAPSAERTHWHQIRFLFKEPLAVNAGETIRGWFHLRVNDMRSYRVEAELVLGETEVLSEPQFMDARRGAGDIPQSHSSHGGPMKNSRPHPARRRDAWELQDQTYYYGFDPTFPNAQEHQPEYSCLYVPTGEEEAVNGDGATEMSTEA